MATNILVTFALCFGAVIAVVCAVRYARWMADKKATARALAEQEEAIVDLE